MQQTENPPIACTLDHVSLEQRKCMLWKLIGKATGRVELTDGYDFLFAGNSVSLAELADIIALERKCCAFLRFVLTVEPAGGPVRLQLSGAPGTKDFLTSLLPA